VPDTGQLTHTRNSNLVKNDNTVDSNVQISILTITYRRFAG